MGPLLNQARTRLRDRCIDGQIPREDLFALAEWQPGDANVPDGEWHVDFDSFELRGTGNFPTGFLMN